ncbi:F-box domain containing protein [Tanacetum coccineum]
MSDNIPFDLQLAIMNRLLVKSLLQFRTVSKSWKDGPWHVLLYTLNSDTWTVLENYRLPRNSLVISGNLIHYENRYICAWLLEVEAIVITSWRVLFVIPSQNIAKLLRFTMDDDPIVEVDSGQEMVHTLQVYDRPSQQFHNVGIEGDARSFFIGPYKESLILLNV